MANPQSYMSLYGFLHGGIWCITIASFLWSIWSRYFSRASGGPVPGLKTPPYSIFGNLYTLPSTEVLKKTSLPISAFVIQTYSALSKLFEEEKLFYFDMGPSRMIILRKPEVVEELLKSNRLLRKSFLYNFMMPWLGTGLLTSAGSKWRSRRKLLTPSFHFNILKDFLPAINEQSKILIDILKQRANEKFVEVTQLIAMCSLDIICASTLGVDVAAQRNSNSEYVQAVLRASKTIMERVCSPHLWPEILFRMSTGGRQFQKDIQTLHGFTKKVIRQKQRAFKQRLEEEELRDISCSGPRSRRKAFMDVLIEHQMKYHDITEEDIREEVDTFVFEGHDTTSVGISWALYLVGLHPDVQAKLHEEIDNIYGDDIDRPVTEDDIRDMRYLDCVLKESQRLYPSVPLFGRDVEEDQDFCQRFALMEEKVVISDVLRNFNVKSLDQRDKIVPETDLVLRPCGPLRLKFIPRTPARSDAC